MRLGAALGEVFNLRACTSAATRSNPADNTSAGNTVLLDHFQEPCDNRRPISRGETRIASCTCGTDMVRCGDRGLAQGVGKNVRLALLPGLLKSRRLLEPVPVLLHAGSATGILRRCVTLARAVLCNNLGFALYPKPLHSSPSIGHKPRVDPTKQALHP